MAEGPQPTLRILETRVLRGPNMWSRNPAIVMLVNRGRDPHRADQGSAPKTPTFSDSADRQNSS